jgi:hypothetical protein
MPRDFGRLLPKFTRHVYHWPINGNFYSGTSAIIQGFIQGKYHKSFGFQLLLSDLGNFVQDSNLESLGNLIYNYHLNLGNFY